MFSNWPSTKPTIAPPVHCARRGESSPRKSKTTARRSRRIGKGFVRSIHWAKSKFEKRRSLFVQGSRSDTKPLGDTEGLLFWDRGERKSASRMLDLHPSLCVKETIAAKPNPGRNHEHRNCTQNHRRRRPRG